MTTDNKPAKPKKKPKTKADKRADALRANLMKRKQQNRARKDADKEESE